MNVISLVFAYIFGTADANCAAGNTFNVVNCTGTVKSGLITIFQALLIVGIFAFMAYKLLTDHQQRAILMVGEAVILALGVFFIGNLFA